MAAAEAPLDADTMARFERDGFAVVTLPLTAEELQAAADAWDRNVDPIIDDAGYIGLISHPCVEAIAKQVLRAERVFILESGRAERPGVEPGTPPPTEFAERHGHATEWANGLHSDVQVTAGDWEATPRREHLAIWMWMDDVTPERGAIRILPGSHLTLGAHWEEMMAQHRDGQSLPLPRSGQHGDYEGDYDQVEYAGLEPFPVSARRGQALIFSQALMQ